MQLSESTFKYLPYLLLRPGQQDILRKKTKTERNVFKIPPKKRNSQGWSQSHFLSLPQDTFGKSLNWIACSIPWSRRRSFFPFFSLSPSQGIFQSASFYQSRRTCVRALVYYPGSYVFSAKSQCQFLSLQEKSLT